MARFCTGMTTARRARQSNQTTLHSFVHSVKGRHFSARLDKNRRSVLQLKETFDRGIPVTDADAVQLVYLRAQLVMSARALCAAVQTMRLISLEQSLPDMHSVAGDQSTSPVPHSPATNPPLNL